LRSFKSKLFDSKMKNYSEIQSISRSLNLEIKNEYIRLLDSNSHVINKFCEDHKYIYKYLPFERFLEVLHKKQLAFVSPTKWNDPFDNFLFKYKNEKSEITFLNKLFVGCFTLNPHSQAYWKTYAPEGYSVRLQFETRKLFGLISKLKDRAWYGELNYKRENEIVEIFQNTEGLKDSLEEKDINDIFLKVFTLKRKPFEYEKEVRIIIESNRIKEGIRKVNIELKDFISSIYLDPRIKTNEEIAFKEYLRHFGIKVTKSQLFQERKITIK
jgi:hypothetical protein